MNLTAKRNLSFNADLQKMDNFNTTYRIISGCGQSIKSRRDVYNFA